MSAPPWFTSTLRHCLPEPSSSASTSTAAGRSVRKASPDPDEKHLLISGAPAAPLPNTKLSPREAPQEPTDGEYSCWVKADVTGRRERSIPERRIGVKAAAGWSERKGVAWSRGLLAFPRARNHRASSFRAIKKGFSAAITEARLMRMARGRVGVGRAVRKKQRGRQKHRGNVVFFFPLVSFRGDLFNQKNSDLWTLYERVGVKLFVGMNFTFFGSL